MYEVILCSGKSLSLKIWLMGAGSSQKLHYKLVGSASQTPKLNFPLPVSTAPCCQVCRWVRGEFEDGPDWRNWLATLLAEVEEWKKRTRLGGRTGMQQRTNRSMPTIPAFWPRAGHGHRALWVSSPSLPSMQDPAIALMSQLVTNQ